LTQSASAVRLTVSTSGHPPLPDIGCSSGGYASRVDTSVRNREHVVSKDDLVNAIWNGRIVSDVALTTRLNAARSAIGDSGKKQRLIRTLPRKGFRFVGTVREAKRAAGEPVSDTPAEQPKPSRSPTGPPSPCCRA